MILQSDESRSPAPGSIATDILTDDVRELIAAKRPRRVALSTIELLVARSIEDRKGQGAIEAKPVPAGSPDEAGSGADRPVGMIGADDVNTILDALQKSHPGLFQEAIAEPAPPPKNKWYRRKTADTATAPTTEKPSKKASKKPDPESEPIAVAPAVADDAEPRAARPNRLKEAAARYRSSLPDIASGLRRAARTASVRSKHGAVLVKDGSYRLGGFLREYRVLVGAAVGVAFLVSLLAALLPLDRAPPANGDPVEAPSQQAAAPQDKIESPPPADTKPTAETAAPRKELSGTAQVIDTSLLVIDDQKVRLFGVTGIEGSEVDEFKKYLGSKVVTCVLADESSSYRCNASGRDLSEVVVFNGGGRASAEATPDLLAAEEHARSERLGLWKR